MRSLEELYGALMLFGCLARVERTQVSALSGLGIQFLGIQTVFPGLEFSDHTPEGAGIVP